MPRHRLAARMCLVLVVATAAVGCASLPPACMPGETPMTSETLYFGRQSPLGEVSAEQWAQFLATQVTPRFPRGFTVWPASGQWQSADGSITRESSYALVLLHADDAASEAAVRAVVADYKTRFQQEAVLRVRARTCASF